MVIVEKKHVCFEADRCRNLLNRPGNEVLYAAVVSYTRSGVPVFRTSLNALHQALLRHLNKLSVSPENCDEAQQQKLVHLVMSRTLPHRFPLFVLTVLDPSWKELLAHLKTDPKSILSVLDRSQQKLVKFALLLYSRMCSLKIHYMRPQAMPTPYPREKLAKCTVTVCGYCYELLTYFGTGKRPASFGWFFDMERMEQRCYRDDSDHLHLVRLADSASRLSISMPDRPPVSACIECYELVEAGTQLVCSSCDWKPPVPAVCPETMKQNKEEEKQHNKRSAFKRAFVYEQDRIAFRRLIR